MIITNKGWSKERLKWKEYAWYKYTLCYSKQTRDDLLSDKKREDYNMCEYIDKNQTFKPNKFYNYFTGKCERYENK